MLAVLKWLFSSGFQAWQESRLRFRQEQSARLDKLEAEINETLSGNVFSADRTCLLNMLYHIKLERILKGL